MDKSVRKNTYRLIFLRKDYQFIEKMGIEDIGKVVKEWAT